MKKNGGRVGKQRQLGTDETNVVEKTEIGSCKWENDRIILKRIAPVGNRIEMTISINKKG